MNTRGGMTIVSGWPMAFAWLALLAVVAAAGSVPHVHVDTEAAFYNLEHDLSLLAAGAGLGEPPPIVAAIGMLLVIVAVAAFPAPGRPRHTARSGASRAPPGPA